MNKTTLNEFINTTLISFSLAALLNTLSLQINNRILLLTLLVCFLVNVAIYLSDILIKNDKYFNLIRMVAGSLIYFVCMLVMGKLPIGPTLIINTLTVVPSIYMIVVGVVFYKDRQEANRINELLKENKRDK